MTYKTEDGYLRGKHYTEYVEVIIKLKRDNKLLEAELLLLEINDVLKNEFIAGGKKGTIPPWYFEQLAIIYRKQKKYIQEKEILEEYLQLNKNDESNNKDIEYRYSKIKEILSKN